MMIKTIFISLALFAFVGCLSDNDGNKVSIPRHSARVLIPVLNIRSLTPEERRSLAKYDECASTCPSKTSLLNMSLRLDGWCCSEGQSCCALPHGEGFGCSETGAPCCGYGLQCDVGHTCCDFQNSSCCPSNTKCCAAGCCL